MRSTVRGEGSFLKHTSHALQRSTLRLWISLVLLQKMIWKLITHELRNEMGRAAETAA